MKRWLGNIGPGPIIAAAFIGPGTVTICTLAGVEFGYDLLWALVLSIVTTIVLQEMAARIGLISQAGLLENLTKTIKAPILKYFSIILVMIAIVLGNTAYEAGNITGGALGASLIVQLPVFKVAIFTFHTTHLIMGGVAFGLLISGNMSVITKFLTGLVVFMSGAFLLSAIFVFPSWRIFLKGLVPQFDPSNFLVIVAIIGTTVVPYNLFLHASLVAKKWSTPKNLNLVRKDTFAAIIIGGLVSMAIVITGASQQGGSVTSAVDMAVGLEPLLGTFATYFIAFGLFAAGLTSAMTAPMAAALVVCGSFGWSTSIKSLPMRFNMGLVLLMGLLFASLGIRPVQLITIAQVANGILLPLIAAYLIWLVNRPSMMGSFKNTFIQNLIAGIIWLITLILGAVSLWRIFGN
ncbi:NRAMP family divalent metal transporter [Mongoliitalea daihaiensis]|uniref:NRAMP family divalent metal transporter n=1 Tax=Mongoliitalea daihaiensis TaxID=2782006 RepID=UPI001F427707|nr:divalent metal cation transporter [Mongoliitalea daihaiensis]UJP64213.1 divalent metal cation transporter [Mongoliitalea daihaiensis]